MKKIKLMADYNSWPLWYDDLNDEYNVGSFDPNSWPISSSLSLDLEEWQKKFNSTIDMDNPSDAGFNSYQELECFIEEGRSLKKRLEIELPRIDISYPENFYSIKPGIS
jgi:hypothetical protein